MAVPRRKRTIMIKIWVEGKEVRFDQVGLKSAMLDLDEQFAADLKTEQEKARTNRDRRNAGAPLEKGQRVRADDYVKEPEYPHPGIHLSAEAGDEVMWYCEQELKFTVDIHRDPELVLLDRLVVKGKDEVKVGKNNRLESPFRDDFPLVSFRGEPVFSSPLRDDEAVFNQRYYKYTVTVDGVTTPLDPHIEGHNGGF